MRHPASRCSLALTLLCVLFALLLSLAPRSASAAFQLPPFLQTLSEQTLSQSQLEGSDRLFTLPSAVANVPNIRRFTPRKKHLKPHKLMRRLRKDWDPFWMSAERPQDAEDELVKQAPVDPTLLKAVERLNFTIRAPDGVDMEIEESVTHVIGAWLMQKSTCHVHYVWDDLGILYWPRWVRRGFCGAEASRFRPSSSSYASSTPSLSASCSWPPGMHCVPAESRRIRILRWQCRHNKAFNTWNTRGLRQRRPRKKKGGVISRVSPGREKREARPLPLHHEHGVKNHTERAAGDDESNETENWSRKPFKDRRRKMSMRCKWKKIPYPVTDDCFCSC